MRAFIAIELPEEIKETLNKLTQKLKTAEADVKWVEPKNIHLTLKFLGEIDEQIKNQVSSEIKKICQTKKPFAITISNLGAFPNTNSPKVIWVGIKQGDNEVKEIAKTIEEHLTTIRFPQKTSFTNEVGEFKTIPCEVPWENAIHPQKNREFSSHITIGRTRSGKNRLELAKLLLNLNQNLSTRQFIISKITLFKSTLTPHGPIYEPINSFQLITNHS